MPNTTLAVRASNMTNEELYQILRSLRHDAEAWCLLLALVESRFDYETFKSLLVHAIVNEEYPVINQ